MLLYPQVACVPHVCKHFPLCGTSCVRLAVFQGTGAALELAQNGSWFYLCELGIKLLVA